MRWTIDTTHAEVEFSAKHLMISTVKGRFRTFSATGETNPDGTIKAPFAMKVEFQPHGGSKIDANSVKVTYLKKPAVDLTPRMKSAISESGINLGDANVPAGASIWTFALFDK